MTPIDGRRHPKGDAWGKRIPKLNQRRGSGCLSVLIPTIPARVGPRARARVAGRPALTQVPPGRPARGAS